eukprot:TRINITY_DN3579_c0_g1_i1.p1 TRINITY_DN3579_c0_g1~~TRINITY_DN3579_c0_g1_i1.p1  ORF type:complete len:320 (-),score=181.00 TRINITY_DN3579_c0_g1_i1:94-1053(-)
MTMLRTLAVAVLCIGALGFDEGVWTPNDSVHALDGVITAVNSLVSNPHLSAVNLAKAKKVAEDVKADIEAVEGGKLSKQQAHEKVGAAMKELMSFQTQLMQPAAGAAAGDKAAKLANLEKELEAKKAELAKAENMLKLMKLKKALAEKKLKLQKLIDQKNAAKKSGDEAQAEAAKTNEMVKALSTAVADMKDTKKDSKAELKTVLATVHARKEEVSTSIANMEAMEKKAEGEMESVIKAQMPGGAGKGDEKAKAMLKQLKAEEHRKFAKVEAVKKLQLNELKDAEASIEKHDVAALERTLDKMEKDAKTLQSKSGKFLV